MQISVKSVALATQLYWFLAVHAEESEFGESYKRWQEELLLCVKGDASKDLVATRDFVLAFRSTEDPQADPSPKAFPNLDAKPSPDPLPNLTSQADPEMRIEKLMVAFNDAHLTGDGKSIPLLTRPKERVVQVKMDEARVIESATLPVIVPCVCASGRTQSIMYKKDDLQKDVLVMGAIRIMKVILQQAGIVAPLTTYSILATSSTDGFIEIVKESQTLYALQQEGSLKDRLVQCARITGKQLDAVQDRFMRSVAAYCVVTYLLGIGDRHLDNLMLAPSGELFHIDFSFVLGRDAKPLMPPMRLSNDMVEAMGGEMSIPYRAFHQVCEQIFLCLRRRPSFFATLLLALVPDSSTDNVSDWEFNIDDLHREIVHRFMPGLSDPEAASEFRKRIDDSALFSVAEAVSDMVRHVKKQGVVGQVAEVGWSWLRPAVSAFSVLASSASDPEASQYPGEVHKRVSDPGTARPPEPRPDSPFGNAMSEPPPGMDTQ